MKDASKLSISCDRFAFFWYGGGVLRGGGHTSVVGVYDFVNFGGYVVEMVVMMLEEYASVCVVAYYVVVEWVMVVVEWMVFDYEFWAMMVV